MQDHERERLKEIAEEAARIIFEALSDAQAQARTNLFNARLRGDISGPELIKRREQELETAKQRLRSWATANPSTGYHRRFAPDKDQRRIAQLAAQIAAAAEAAVREG
jgi:hypothetical protein